MDMPLPAENLELFVFSLEGLCDPGLPIAAARAGAVGFLNLASLRDESAVAAQVERLMRLAHGRYGLVLRGRLGAVELAALNTLRDADTVLLTCEDETGLAEAVARCR